MVNASYTMGATTLSAGWNNGDRLAAGTSTSGTAAGAAVSTDGYRMGIRHTMGNIGLMASYTQQNAGSGASGAEVKSKVTGLRADYNFSKTAAAYVGYENWDTGTAYASTLTSGTRKIVSMGLRKSF
jgi:predicted porin